MDAVMQFKQEKEENIQAMNLDPETQRLGKAFQDQIIEYNYSYNYTWMGRPIIQIPQDIVALQEAVMKVQPDLIIETGIAHGGSLILSASMMELLDIFAGGTGPKREVVGVDIEIRPHNRTAIEAHPMYRRITMLEGSTTDLKIVAQVESIARQHETIMVLLDSYHTHEHVLKELQCYSPLVTKGSYVVVYDTVVEFTSHIYQDRPWKKGNNPYTAVQAFLKDNGDFEVDPIYDRKSVLTSCRGGWLKRISE